MRELKRVGYLYPDLRALCFMAGYHQAATCYRRADRSSGRAALVYRLRAEAIRWRLLQEFEDHRNWLAYKMVAHRFPPGYHQLTLPAYDSIAY